MIENIKVLIKNKFSILVLFIIILSCENNKGEKILLKNTINHENTISFTYNSNGIEEVLTTFENKKYFKSKNYLVKRTDGYYEDVDLVVNDSIKDYRKVLVKYNYDYSYKVSVPMPSFDGVFKVSIKKIDSNRYMYNSISGNTGIRYFFDENFRIYKVVRILSPKDSLIYE